MKAKEHENLLSSQTLISPYSRRTEKNKLPPPPGLNIENTVLNEIVTLEQKS